MTSVALLDPNRPVKATALIVAARASDGEAEPVSGAEIADEILGGQLRAALKATRARGKADEITKIPTLGHSQVDVVVVVGLGEQPGDLDSEAVRRAVGGAVRVLAGADSVIVSVGEDDSVLAAAAEGAGLGGYAFNRYKSGAGTEPVKRVQLRAAATAARRTGLKRAGAITSAVHEIRDLVNTAPAELYPATFAARAGTLATAAGCEVEVLDEKALAKGGYGGIVGVGRGSVHPPRLVRITHRPARPRARIALVGKGITFDSGGYSLKVPQSGAMKGDMAGAATVLLAVIAAARLNLPVEVTATAAMAENLVSGTSYLVSDVLRMRGGKTVEVDNTDAEGRLVLADAIVRAGEDNPDLLLEASTLTGAAPVALGQRTAAVLGVDSLREEVLAAAGEAGEPMWPLPLLADLRTGLDSPVADLRNVSGDRYGGTITAGLFLGEFVKSGLPWAHIDMAGPAWHSGGAYGYTPKGGTGYGLRTMLRLMERAGERRS